MSAPDRLKKDLATVETIIKYLEKDEKKDGEEQKKLGSDVIRAMKEGWEKEVEVKREKGEDVTKDEIEVVSMNPSLLIRGKTYALLGETGSKNSRFLITLFEIRVPYLLLLRYSISIC